MRPLIPRLHAFRRGLSTQDAGPSLEAGIAKILHSSKNIPDHLSPTHSHLLNLLFSDIFSSSTSTAPSRPKYASDSSAPLPQGHHLVYFPLQSPPSVLMPDGTDPDHCPGAPFTRRLWAGGEVRFHEGWEDELRLDGRRVDCVESVEDVRHEKGKVWVELSRLYAAAGGQRGPSIEERRRLAFLPKVDTPSHVRRSLKAKQEPTLSLTLTPAQNLLTNFSALTYNAHAIHLDPAWAAKEGHKRTLVHGPLSLALVLAFLNSQGLRVLSFNYRNLWPLYCGQEMRICIREKPNHSKGRNWDVWIENEEGGLSVKGTATTVDAP